MITTGSSLTLAPPVHAVADAEQPKPSHHFSFGDFLDIVNPLQHIPVIGTLYRAITGDKIDTPEKLAGDTLYGGPLGAISSLADIGFKEITGKDFGDTVLSWLTGKHGDKPKTVADAAPSQAPAPVQRSTTAGESALHASLDRIGMDPATAQRAVFAYRRGLTATSAFFSAN